MTLPELKDMRDIFNLLFDLAEPVVRERDRIAQNAFREGDDSFARIYRTVQQFVIREEAVKSDGSSIRDRLEDVVARLIRKQREEADENSREIQGKRTRVAGHQPTE